MCFIRLLLERGADIRKGLHQDNPMFLATSLKSPYAARELLRHGGNANEIIDGKSVLNVACCWKSSTLIARILLAAGVKPNSISCRQWLSSLLNNSDLIELLWNYRAIINIINDVVIRTSYQSQQ